MERKGESLSRETSMLGTAVVRVERETGEWTENGREGNAIFRGGRVDELGHNAAAALPVGVTGKALEHC